MGRPKPLNVKHPRPPKPSQGRDSFTAPISQIPPSHPSCEQFYKRHEGKTPRWKKILKIGSSLLAGVAVLIYGGQLYVMKQQLNEMSKSREQSDRQYTISQRPWIGIDGPITLTKLIPGEHLRVEYATKIKNFGSSPAFAVIPRVDVVLGQRTTDIAHIMSAVCKEIDKTVVPLKVGEVVFPTDTYTFPTEGWPDNSYWKVPSSTSDPVYFFAGCIAYLDSANTLHHTQVCQWTDKSSFSVGSKLSSCSRPFAD